MFYILYESLQSTSIFLRCGTLTITKSSKMYGKTHSNFSFFKFIKAIFALKDCDLSSV